MTQSSLRGDHRATRLILTHESVDEEVGEGTRPRTCDAPHLDEGAKRFVLGGPAPTWERPKAADAMSDAGRCERHAEAWVDRYMHMYGCDWLW